MPVWHASVSLRNPSRGQQVQLTRKATIVARWIAALALEGVGSDKHEWWLNNGTVAHLRVATTPEEQTVAGEGLVQFDAGATGTLTKGRISPAEIERKLLS